MLYSRLKFILSFLLSHGALKCIHYAVFVISYCNMLAESLKYFFLYF